MSVDIVARQALAKSRTAPLYVNRARRILRAAEHAQPTGTMGSAPTYTQGTADANSTVNTSATAQPMTGGGAHPTYTPGNSSVFEFVSCVGVLDPYNGYGWIPTQTTKKASGNYALLGSDGWGVRFCTDAQTFDFLAYLNSTHTGSGAGGAFRVRVTDVAAGTRQWTRASDYTGDTNWRYQKIDFGSRAPRGRIIEIYFTGNAWFVGVNVGAQDMVWKAPIPDEPKVCYFGDSYGESVGATSLRTSLPYALGEILGVPNVICSAVAGTGYVNAGSGVNWQTRAARDLATSTIGEMDLVVVLGSINDNGSADNTTTAAITAVLSAAMSAQPNAVFQVVGPQYVNTGQTTSGRFAVVKAAVQAMPGYGSRLFYCDNGPVGENWQTGTGYSGATTSSGNGDYYVYSDGTHPNLVNGADYLAERLAATTLANLRSLVASYS